MITLEAFNKIDGFLAEINSANPADAAALETFRIRFLGSKNVLKGLFGEMKTVPNERKKEFGQAMNALKLAAEEKYAHHKEQLESAADASALSLIHI